MSKKGLYKTHCIQSLLLSVCLCISALYTHTTAVAQTEVSHNGVAIFQQLAAPKSGTGTITIKQPDAIKQQVGIVRSEKMTSEEESEESSLVGYRILIYMGNMANSKEEAYRRVRMLANYNSSLPCYVKYKAPFWKVTAGNFSSKEEANAKLLDLKREFPSIAAELYIVTERIKLHR